MGEPRQHYQLLLVEDNTDLAAGLAVYFRGQGYEVETAHEGGRAIGLLRERRFDIVVLDLMMPGVTGFDVLRQSALEATARPTLVLSGLDEQENILRAFDLGATDYLVKPFSVEELAARVRAILQRTLPPSSAPMEVHQVGDVGINFSTHEALRDGADIGLTALEFDVLKYLLQHKGQIVTRKMLLRGVWNIEHDIATRTIDRHVASLRRKIEIDPLGPALIETIYGVGYRLKI